MKMNVKKVLCTLCCLIMCATMYAQDKACKLSGSWSFSAPDAPYGYQAGTFKFDEKDGKLTAVVDINGSAFTISEIKKGTEAYTCSFDVDGSFVSLSIKQKDTKLEGVAEAEGTVIPLKFTPAPKK